MPAKKNILGVVLLLALSLFLGLGMNYLSPSGIALVGQWNTEKGVVSARARDDAVHGDIEINNPMEVRRIVTQKEMMILDVRPAFVYEEGHLPGAYSFPLDEFDDLLDQLLKLVKRDTPILVYCSGFQCTDSHTFASRLMDLQFSRVRVFAGGFAQWQEMGFEIE
ncbi:rhodanese-like domain-containing protein [Desulfospira joergensenii]|uniref:rhodanese-like domain-containing protein n=1 Tax=Desulfospira joergensenii TaxID=53329 RepID=UPI0003B438C9|nr:rhodanese-like domain-containing protein [Desulfospira joergensenii]